MKLGRKGFMLVEVVVVSTVISTILVTMYTAITRVSNAYKTRDSYNNIDALYLAMTENDTLIRDKDLEQLIQNNTAIEISNDDLINMYMENNTYVHLYFSPYNKDKILTIKEKSNIQTTKNYIDYITDKLDFNDSNYNYLIISEICRTEDDCYYYALKQKINTNG